MLEWTHNQDQFSNFNPKSFSKQGTLRFKKNDLVKHWFTGKFLDDESPTKITNVNIGTPMTVQENLGMLKLIKEMVFSNVMSFVKDTCKSETYY